MMTSKDFALTLNAFLSYLRDQGCRVFPEPKGFRVEAFSRQADQVCAVTLLFEGSSNPHNPLFTIQEVGVFNHPGGNPDFYRQISDMVVTFFKPFSDFTTS